VFNYFSSSQAQQHRENVKSTGISSNYMKVGQRKRKQFGVGGGMMVK
jgi:hypothetical protein